MKSKSFLTFDPEPRGLLSTALTGSCGAFQRQSINQARTQFLLLPPLSTLLPLLPSSSFSPSLSSPPPLLFVCKILEMIPYQNSLSLPPSKGLYGTLVYGYTITYLTNLLLIVIWFVSNFLPLKRILHKRIESRVSNSYLYKNVYSSFIHSSRKAEISQVSIRT